VNAVRAEEPLTFDLVIATQDAAENLVLPPAGPLLLALLGFFAAQSPPAAGAHLFDSGFGSIWLLSTPIVSDGVTRLVERYPPLNLQLAADAQAIVILGGGGQRALAPEYGGPAAEPLLLER